MIPQTAGTTTKIEQNLPLNVLLIEDSPAQSRLYSEMLSSSSRRCSVVRAASLADAVNRLENGNFDVVVTDLTLPDSQGLNTFLEVYKRVPSLPIIILTALDAETSAIDALKLGAQDYLIKGQVNASLLLRSVTYSVERARVERAAKDYEIQSATLQLTSVVESSKYTINELEQQRDDLISILAHDVKTSVLGQQRVIELLTGGSIPDQNQHTDLLAMLEKSNQSVLTKLSKLVEIHKYSQPQNSALNWVDLASLVRVCASQLKPAANAKGIKLRVDVDEQLAPILADFMALKVLMVNLIDNAVRYTNSGGLVEVAAMNISEQEVLISVRDTGVGIDKEQQSTLFQRLWQGDLGVKTGIAGFGLYICARIIATHGGTISCQSEPKVGTTITLTLPVNSGNDYAPPAPFAPNPI